MSYESFSYNVEAMCRKSELNELTKALNSGIDKDILYKAFRDLYEATISSKLVRGGDGLNVDGLFVDVNTENTIYSLLDVVKAYLKFNMERKDAIQAAFELSRKHYLIAASEDERTRHLNHMEELQVGIGIEGDVEVLRHRFWNTLRADLEAKVSELLN